MKNILIGVLILAAGYFLKEFVQDYIYQQSKQSFEASLFPRIKNLPTVADMKCEPSFIYHSATQLLLYCNGIDSKDLVVREEVRKLTRSELEKWAIENKVEKQFLYVSFIDEVTFRGKK